MNRPWKSGTSLTRPSIHLVPTHISQSHARPQMRASGMWFWLRYMWSCWNMNSTRPSIWWVIDSSNRPSSHWVPRDFILKLFTAVTYYYVNPRLQSWANVCPAMTRTWLIIRHLLMVKIILIMSCAKQRSMTILYWTLPCCRQMLQSWSRHSLLQVTSWISSCLDSMRNYQYLQARLLSYLHPLFQRKNVSR